MNRANEISDIQGIILDWKNDLERKEGEWVALAKLALATGNVDDRAQANEAYTDLLKHMADGPTLPPEWRTI